MDGLGVLDLSGISRPAFRVEMVIWELLWISIPSLASFGCYSFETFTVIKEGAEIWNSVQIWPISYTVQFPCSKIYKKTNLTAWYSHCRLTPSGAGVPLGIAVYLAPKAWGGRVHTRCYCKNRPSKLLKGQFDSSLSPAPHVRRIHDSSGKI